MKKNMTLIEKELVVSVGSFEKSSVDGWIRIYTEAGERIGGFDILNNRLQVIHKNIMDNDIYLIYTIINKEEVK